MRSGKPGPKIGIVFKSRCKVVVMTERSSAKNEEPPQVVQKRLFYKYIIQIINNVSPDITWKAAIVITYTTVPPLSTLYIENRLASPIR